jgi:outer membrane protein assembly factor BamD (BamD/ComL family)
MAESTVNLTPIDPATLVDIWSRPGLWARQRAYIFLSINILVYTALTIFLFWLHRAQLFDFSWSSYAATYHKTLIDFLVFPISVHEAPVLIPIFGMIMANIIIVPILVAQLYGFRFSIPFACCVLIFAHLPVLSVFLVASSFIAGASRKKLPFKFGVAVLGLLPLAIYFYVATRGANVLQYHPVDPSLLYAPWILSFLAAGMIAGVVLGFARLVKYRPGGILVMMIPFFAIPVVLFNYYVGVDQLEFRVIAHQYGKESDIFVPVDISNRVFQETIRNWKKYKIRSLQAIVDLAEVEFQYIAEEILQNDRQSILDACDKFRKQFPQSKFIPNVLYITGMAHDMRYDNQVLMKNWIVEYHCDLVSPISRKTWELLVKNYPDSVFSIPGRLRLAILSVRDEDVTQSKKILQDLLDRSQNFSKPADTQPAAASLKLFTRAESINIPHIEVNDLVEQAQELYDLISQNSDDPIFGNKPLADLMRLDERHPNYHEQLLELAVKYSGGKLHDNLLVRFALTEPDPNQRKQLLERYTTVFMGKDAGAQALYELGRLLQAWGLVNLETQSRKQAVECYKRLQKEYPTSIFTSRAANKLKKLN